jgi:cobalt-zinc-cadmium efflux system outer membrane protein
VSENYRVDGTLAHQSVALNEQEARALAVQNRPDLRAAQLAVAAAQSQHTLAQANAKRDVTAQASYTHVAATNTGSLFANFELPIFDRNQGEVARTQYAIAQSQELSLEQSSVVMTDVANAYEALRTDDQVVQLYESGYRKQAQDSRDISQYAYQRGAATLLDFLDAQRSYRAVELAYRQALAAYMVALEQLRQAVGTRSLP